MPQTKTTERLFKLRDIVLLVGVLCDLLRRLGQDAEIGDQDQMGAEEGASL